MMTRYATLFLLSLLFTLSQSCVVYDGQQAIDEASRQLVRDFYADDASIAESVSVLLDWYQSEGAELLEPRIHPVVLADLEPEDLKPFNLQDQGLRDPTLTTGVIEMQPIDCNWYDIEHLMVHPDQAAVLPGAFDSYERTFEDSLQTYLEDVPHVPYIDEPLHPELQAADPQARPDVLLRTVNDGVVKEGGMSFDYHTVVHFRHSLVDINGEHTALTMALSHLPNAVESDSTVVVEQSYGLEMVIERDSGQSIRAMMLWNYVTMPGIGPDSDMWPGTMVGKMRSTADRLSELCVEGLPL